MTAIGEMFDAAQVINKTLIAKVKRPVFKNPGDTVPYGYVKSGDPVGVVYSYLAPGPTRSQLWWVFRDDINGDYYTPHDKGYFDIDSLKKQGALTVDEQYKQKQQEEDRLNMPAVEYYLKYYGKYLLIGGIGIAAASGMMKGIFSSRSI